MNHKEYAEWQPKYAAYEKWNSDTVGDRFIEIREEQRLQAIIEMVSEAGEVLAIAQKARRKGLEMSREKILDETGDVLWGLTGIWNTFGITLEEVIEYNVKKLTDRNTK